MDKDELISYLRENLKINLSTKESRDFYSQGYKIEVSLELEGEVICEASDTLDVATRDTSENWRRTFDD